MLVPVESGNTVVCVLPFTQIDAKLWTNFHKHLQNKKSNANSFLQNLLGQPLLLATTSNSFGMTEWVTGTMQNSSPSQTDHLTPHRLPGLQSAQGFCCCFSRASQECSNSSFPNRQRNLQVVIHDNYLFSHQASKLGVGLLFLRPWMQSLLGIQAVPVVQKAFWRWKWETTSWISFISMVKASWTRGHSRPNSIRGCYFHTLLAVLISKQMKVLLDL